MLKVTPSRRQITKYSPVLFTIYKWLTVNLYTTTLLSWLLQSTECYKLISMPLYNYKNEKRCKVLKCHKNGNDCINIVLVIMLQY
jgi:hypothetical protein